MTRTTSLRFFVLLPAALFLTHCASELDQAVENAQFLLDKGLYVEAEAAIRPQAEAHPTDVRANFVLASALLGQGVLGQGRSYLGMISDVLRDRQPGESAFATFARIAPADVSNFSKLQEARDLLITTSGFVPPSDQNFEEVFLQLFIGRLFEIASTLSKLGWQDVSANPAADQVCNADPIGFSAFKDGIPDTFLADPLSLEEMTRMQEDLQEIDGDGINAGLPADFAVATNAASSSTDLANEVATAGGNVVVGALNFLTGAFSISTAICIIPN